MKIQYCLVLSILLAPPLSAQSEITLTLPEPTGPHAVGSLVWHWIDNERLDELSEPAGDYREVTVQAWYPSDADSASEASPYAPYYSEWSTVSSWSQWMPALTQSNDILPVLIIAPGRGMASHYYTTVAEEFASHGYFVAAINSPYSGRVAYPDGRQILPSERYAIPFETLIGPYEAVDEFYAEAAELGAADIRFALRKLEEINSRDPQDRFTHRLDLTQLAAFGHSLGGRLIGAVVDTDQRFIAYASMEGVPPRTARKRGMDSAVMMMLSSELPDMAQPNIRDVIPERRNDVYIATLQGFGHNSVSDLPLLQPEAYRYEVDTLEGVSIVRTLLRLFFDQYLKSDTSQLLTQSTQKYVRLEVFNKNQEILTK